MAKLLCYYDAYLEDSTNRHTLALEMEENITLLLTWGVILYNKNSELQKSGFSSIQRSRNNLTIKVIKKKIELLKSYFLRPYNLKDFPKSHIRDILRLSQQSYLRGRPSDNYFLQRLHELVF